MPYGKKYLKVGLIGLGNMGRNHLRVLSTLRSVELVFIYDTNPVALYEATSQYGINASTNLTEDLPFVDAVIIATPTYTHFEYIKWVSDYVKYIFVEKPLTDSFASTKLVENLAKQKNLYIQVGFIERFNPVILEVKKILESSRKIINIDYTRTNRLSDRIKDVDVIVDLMIHDIDLAIFLNGSVKEIFAYGMLENNMISFASAILRHDNGVFSRLTASRVTEKRIRKISVTCNDMYVDCDLAKRELNINKQTIEQSYQYISLTSVEENVYVSQQEPLVSELMAFVQSCTSEINNSIIPGIQDAKEAIKVAKEIQCQIEHLALLKQ